VVTDKIIGDMIAYAGKKGLQPDRKGIAISENSIRTQIKALVARIYFQNEGYYKIMKDLDNGVIKAIELLSNN
jgi:hypothetical protein